MIFCEPSLSICVGPRRSPAGAVSVLCVGSPRSLCPAAAVSVLGPGALYVGARRSLCRARRSLCWARRSLRLAPAENPKPYCLGITNTMCIYVCMCMYTYNMCTIVCCTVAKMLPVSLCCMTSGAEVVQMS